jgi:hypothetical protein
MGKLVICTGSDSNLFYLAKGLVLSLRRVLPLYDAELAFFDLGCTQQELAWLQAYSVDVIKPKDDFGIANAEGFKSYMFGQTCRPMLPGYLPGRSTYLWLDADTWVQDVSVIQDFVAIAAEGKAAAVLELDPAYPWYFRRASAFHGYKIAQWTATFGPEVARQLHLATLLNSGVLAMPGNSPLWKRWEDNLVLSLARGPTHLSEQLALQKTLMENNMLFPLAARHNWMCHYALPKKRRSDGLWVEPRPSGQPIGIVHLVASDMRETYLRHGLLFDGGDYLSPEEVPENLRAAFLAGRRRPVIGEMHAAKPD